MGLIHIQCTPLLTFNEWATQHTITVADWSSSPTSKTDSSTYKCFILMLIPLKIIAKCRQNLIKKTLLGHFCITFIKQQPAFTTHCCKKVSGLGRFYRKFSWFNMGKLPNKLLIQKQFDLAIKLAFDILCHTFKWIINSSLVSDPSSMKWTCVFYKISV